MDIYQFQTFVSTNSSAPVYVFAGDEEFFIREALSTLKAHVLKDTDTDTDLALVELSGNDITASALIVELRQRSFFIKNKKLIILENADNFVEENTKTLEKYLSAPSTCAILVLICNKCDKRTKLSGIIQKTGVFVDCKKIKEYHVQNWVISRARHYEKTMNAKAAKQLTENVGNNLAILDKQIEKLSIYKSDKKTIDEKDVGVLVSADRDRTVFEFTEAIAQKDISRSLKILSQLLTHGENSVKIITLLSWQIKRLWRARQLLERGVDEQYIVKELNLVPFFKKRFFEQVKLFTKEDLMRKHAYLLETDVKSKTSTFDKQMLLEILVFKLIN